MSAIAGSMASMPGMTGMTTATPKTTTPSPAPATKAGGMAGCDMHSTTLAGGAGQAAAGASALGGGSDLASVISALQVAIKALAVVVSKLAASTGTKVAGAQGAAASTAQYVAPITVARTTSSSTTEDTAFEAEVLRLINQERAKAGLGAVGFDAELNQAAEKHATQMATVRQMAHEGIGDGDPGERIRAEGFRKAWGENVAVGQTSPAQVVAEWMASPEHKRNILDPKFQLSGIAQTTDASGRKYWAQEFGA
jgi:uncharacterized protein YkwD